MINIRVPASSANLGSGFDCLGLSLDLYLEVKASPAKEDQFLYQGQGHLPNSPNNLIHQGVKAAFNKANKPAPKLKLEVNNPIPLSRGLGSSSAALVAGIAIADALMNEPFKREGIFQLAAQLEGHPDNVAPTVFGGFSLSVKHNDGTYLSRSLALPPSWNLLFAVPNFELPTVKARAVLPETYPRADVIFNASRTALWILAITSNQPELLKLASQDKIHEPYREALVPGLADCRNTLLQNGAYAAYLSGAGPSLGVICSEEHLGTCQEILKGFIGTKGSVLSLNSSQGYVIDLKE